MDNLVLDTNNKLQSIIDDLNNIKNEYTEKLEATNEEIESELKKVKQYKNEFYSSKEKIEKMKKDIEGFESDYEKLVERFKDDELANILVAANKEITAKIDERKKKISKDKLAMSELIKKANEKKNKLIKLIAEKKALELCLAKIIDASTYYTSSLESIIEYATKNEKNLSNEIDLNNKIFIDEIDPEEKEEIEINIDDIDDIENVDNELFDFSENLDLEKIINFEDEKSEEN